ncbi:10811_t:CDS:1 [Ambispora gerdemannii]|uniref:10811_t:CDS:1 n=1 Tax=Ambispora gerdemannii TaxID=144530 RepID=A0A9N9DC31_9GLOM|nr:10811_t:CDS:1 [Ambispora gerdemannii]
MYKPISNFDGIKSPICGQVEARKISNDELYCCSKNTKNCYPFSSDCFGSDYQVAQCHNLTRLDACKRTDLAAVQVCGGLQNSLFCLSVDAISRRDTDYNRFSKAAEWIVNRSTEAESNNITVCDDGTSYQPCNDGTPNGTIAILSCGDLFKSELRCNWSNLTINDGKKIADLPRKPVTELCTTTVVCHDNTALIIGLATGVGVLGIIVIALVALFIRKLQKRDIHVDNISNHSSSDSDAP